MADSTQTYGEFVVACAPIVRGEVHRLRRRGVVLEVEDAMQDGFLFLLEAPDAALRFARLVVRRRLVRAYVQRPKQLKRAALLTSIDDAVGASVPWVPSFEAASVEKLSGIEVDAGPVCSRGHSLTGANVVERQDRRRRTPRRACLACERMRNAARAIA